MSDIRFTKSRNDNRIRHVSQTPPTPNAEVKEGPRFSSDAAAKGNSQRSPKAPPWNLFITSKSDDSIAVSKGESKAGAIEKLLSGNQVVVEGKRNHTLEALKTPTQKDSLKFDEDFAASPQHTKKEKARDLKTATHFKTEALDEDNMFERQEHRRAFERDGMVGKTKTSEIKGDEIKTHFKSSVDSKSNDVKSERVSVQNKKSNKSSSLDSNIFYSVVSSNSSCNKKESSVSKVYSKTEEMKAVNNTHSAIKAVVAKCLDTAEIKKSKHIAAEENAKSQHRGKKEMQQTADHKLDHHERSGNSTLVNSSSISNQIFSELSASCQDQRSLQDKVSYREAKESKVTNGQAQNKLKSLGKKTRGSDHSTNHGQSIDHKSVVKRTVKSEAIPAEANRKHLEYSNSLYTDLEDQALLRERRRREMNRHEKQISISEKTYSDIHPLANDHLWKSHEPKHSLVPKEKTDECKRVQSSMKPLLSENDGIKKSTELTHRDKNSTTGSKPGKLISTLSSEEYMVNQTLHSSLDSIEKLPSASTQQLSSFFIEVASSTCGMNSYSISQDPSSTTLNSIDLPNATTSTVKNTCSSLSVTSRSKEDTQIILSSFSTNAKPNTISSVNTLSSVEKSINKCDPIDSSTSGTNSVLEKTKASSRMHHTKTELTEPLLQRDRVKIDDTEQFARTQVLNESIIGSLNDSNQVSGIKSFPGKSEEKVSAKCENLKKETVALNVHVVTEPSQSGEVSTQLERDNQTLVSSSERLKRHCVVTSTNVHTVALPEVENVIKISGQKNEQKFVYQNVLLPLQNETNVGHQSISGHCVSVAPATEQKESNQSNSKHCIVPQFDDNDSYQNIIKELLVPQTIEKKNGDLNTTQSSPTLMNESKVGHVKSHQSSPTSMNESKVGHVNSHQSSPTLMNESKVGHVKSHQSSPTLMNESKVGHVNSHQSSPTLMNESKVGHVNSHQSSPTLMNESKVGHVNNHQSSPTLMSESKVGHVNSHQSSLSLMNESKVGHVNSNQSSPTSKYESKSGQLKNQSSSSLKNETKSEQLNSNLSVSTLSSESKSGHLINNQFSTTLPYESKPRQMKNQSSSPSQNDSESGQLNDVKSFPVSLNESKSGQPNNNQSSSALLNESKSEQRNINALSSTLQNDSKSGQLKSNQFSPKPKSESKAVHTPITNQSSTQQYANQSSKDSTNEPRISAYRSYRSTQLPGSEQFRRKPPIKRSVSSGALSLRDNHASFFRRINDSYVYANDPADDSDDDDFGIDLEEMFKHLDTRRSRKPTRSYCRSTYSEMDIAETVPDELTASTVTVKSKRHESIRTVRETVSCDRLKIRRFALADPLRMIISQEDRERIEKDVEKRRQSMVRKLSQFINIQFGLNKEEDLI